MTRQVDVDGLTLELFVGDDTTTTFPLSANTDPTTAVIFYNGMRMAPNAGYSVINAAVVFDAPPVVGDTIVVSVETVP